MKKKRICNRCNKVLADDIADEPNCKKCGCLEFRWENRLFDLEEGLRRKEEGKEKAAENREPILIIARKIAKQLADKYGYVHADMVRQAMTEAGHDMKELGSAAGNVFDGPGFVFTGERLPSAWPPNHGREIKVWRSI